MLNNLAWAYQQVKDARALETAERAYKLAPDNAAIADTLGWILVEQGNTKRGIEVLQKAVTAAPKIASYRYHLARGAPQSRRTHESASGTGESPNRFARHAP